MNGLTIDQIHVGDSAEFGKTISESDVYLFAGISGDINPVHLNQPYAEQTVFGGRITHGMLYASFISAVLANQLPGPGTIYLGQDLKFLLPVRIGDTITARVEVIEVLRDRGRVRLKTTCTNQHGKQVLTGEALVSPPRAPRPTQPTPEEPAP